MAPPTTVLSEARGVLEASMRLTADFETCLKQVIASAAPSSCPFAGYIFSCNAGTYDECMKLGVFGAPQPFMSTIRQIRAGQTPLFLYHITNRTLYGVFEPTSDGAPNIHPFAWVRGGQASGQQTQFPAQVAIRAKYGFLPLPEAVFKSIISYRKERPSPLLDHVQVNRLIRAFAENDAATAHRAADQLLQFFQIPF